MFIHNPTFFGCRITVANVAHEFLLFPRGLRYRESVNNEIVNFRDSKRAVRFDKAGHEALDFFLMKISFVSAMG